MVDLEHLRRMAAASLLTIDGNAGRAISHCFVAAADEIERLRGTISVVANCPEFMNAAPIMVQRILHPYRELGHVPQSGSHLVLVALIEDMQYLADHAFEFMLNVNPHAGVHDSVEDYISDRGPGTGIVEGRWVAEEQKEEALRTGRMISGQVYPNGSVSFDLVWGTKLEDVVRECARTCREDRERWLGVNGTPSPGPVGRDTRG